MVIDLKFAEAALREAAAAAAAGEGRESRGKLKGPHVPLAVCVPNTARARNKRLSDLLVQTRFHKLTWHVL